MIMLGLAVSRYFQYISGKEVGMNESNKAEEIDTLEKVLEKFIHWLDKNCAYSLYSFKYIDMVPFG